MTEAQKVDLENVAEGVANLASAYKDATDKVLDPDAIGGSLLDRMPTRRAGVCLFYLIAVRAKLMAVFICRTRL